MGMKLGDLEILEMVATGGMAEVYRARQGDRILAVKKILPHYTQEEELIQMFVDEARLAQTLRHPNIVQTLDLAVTGDGEYFIVMEFADGKDLADLLYAAAVKGQRLTPAMATHIARETLLALGYAHHAKDDAGRPMNLIHRDVSPHNVMVGYDGWVKLTDFGIAKVAHSGHQTVAGVVKGKFGYMSPEQARGKKLDGRSDLYNVGILLYEMILGERLFAGSSDVSTLDRMRSAEVPKLPAVLRCPADLEAIMRRALSKSPDDRFDDAAAFEWALAQVAEKNNLVAGAAEIGKFVRALFGMVRPEPPQDAQPRVVTLHSVMTAPPQPPVARPPPGAPAVRPPPPPPPPPPPTSPAAKSPPGVVIGGKGVVSLEASKAPPRPAPAAGSDDDNSTMVYDTTGLSAFAQPAPTAREPEAGAAAHRSATAPAGAIKSSLPSIASPAVLPKRAPGEAVDDPTRLDPAATSAVLPKKAPSQDEPERTRLDPAQPANRVPVEHQERTRFDPPPGETPEFELPGNTRADAPASGSSPRRLANPITAARGGAQPLPAPTTPRSPAPPPESTRIDATTKPPPRAQSAVRFAETPGESGPITSSRLVALSTEDITAARKRISSEPLTSSAVPAAADAPPPEAPKKEPAPSPGQTSMFQANALAAADLLNEPSAPAAAVPAASPPADDDKERKKQEALERLRAKKAAKAAGDGPPVETPPKESAPPAVQSDGAANGDAREWRTTPDAPPSAPHPDRAGKVLDRPVETYAADARAMARRGAWIIGEPSISPGTVDGPSRQRHLFKTLLPSTMRRRATLLFAASVVASYLLAAHQGAELARRFGPKAAFLFSGELAVQAAGRGAGTTVIVRSAPPGAKVLLDGESAGETPLTLTRVLSEGSHKVQLVRGKQKREVELKIAADQDVASLLVPLQSDGEVSVESAPRDAEVLLDGRVVGKAPMKLVDVGRDCTRLLQVRAGERILLSELLETDRPARSTIRVDAMSGANLVVIVSEPPAWIAVDGKELQRFTGPEPIKLPGGRHTVTLTVPALGLRRDLSVESGRGMRRYFASLYN